MKKFLSLILIAVMLIPVVVYSCDGTGAAVLPDIDTSTDMCGYVSVAVQTSSHFLFGMLSPNEKVNAYPAQTDAGRVRGITAKGINRARGEMRYMVADNAVCGLTQIKASVHIEAGYLEIVTAIVKRCIGEDAEMTAANVVACTIRRESCAVTHMMVGRNVNKVAVGTVLFCGAEMKASLYIADWDADGQIDLVFSVNPGNANKTPEPTTTPKPGKTKPTPKPKKNPCFTIEINIEKIMINHLNIESIFPCGKVEGC